ncbi:hypothetical protein D3C75_620100 [compost metagenome]
MKGKPAWNRGENYKPKKIHPLGKKQPKKESHKQKIRNSNIGKHNHSGELNPGSKLNEEKVIKICELLNQNIHPSKISILFNVSEVTIHRIKGRKAWKKIGEIYLKPKVSMSEAISLNLNDQKVIEICNLLNDDTDINVIVEKFNVTPGVIKRIKNRKTWKHISDKYLKGEMK